MRFIFIICVCMQSNMCGGSDAINSVWLKVIKAAEPDVTSNLYIDVAMSKKTIVFCRGALNKIFRELINCGNYLREEE